MAASSEISLRNVAKALQPLKRDQLISLFVELQVPLHALDNSVSDCKGSEVRIRYSQAWLDHDPEANWEKLLVALKQIGIISLADEIGPQSRVGRALTPQAVEDVTPDPVAPVEGVPESSELAPNVPSSLTTVATTTPSSTTDRVSQVRDTIDQLTDTFLDLLSDARSEMCKKESGDSSFLDKFRDRLLGLPVAQKAIHAKFFNDNEDKILEARNMRKIFVILTRYCNYRNPEILRELVRKFCEAVLQGKMREYLHSLERFEKATTVDVFLVAISARASLSLAFTRMTVRINKPPSVCTLHEIRMFKEDLAERASLQSYGMYIESVSESSVLVMLRFPPSCVGWILAAMTPDFMTTHLLTDVVVDEKQLAIEHTSQRKLNDQLIRASNDRDVVRVVSLLNSGAYINSVHQETSQTPLNWASERGHLQVVRLLIARGADLECRDMDGWTPLITAAVCGKCDVVSELLLEGAVVDAQDNDGGSALMEAARWGYTGVVVELVKARANLDLQNSRGDSAAIKATVEHESATLRELVEAGADLNLHNEEGLTALMIAARSGRIDITDILLEGEHMDLNIQENSTGWSALFFSAERGDVATTQSLLKAGANAQLRDKNGLTPLEVAGARQDDDEVKEKRQLQLDPHYMAWEPRRSREPKFHSYEDYGRVIDLLGGYSGEPATLPSHDCEGSNVDEDGSSAPERDITPSQQDSSTVVEDTPPSPTQCADSESDVNTTTGQQDTTQPRSTVSQDTPPTDTTVTDQILPTPGGRRGRRRGRGVSQAVMNLVNKAGQRARNIFDRLNRRLKSVDTKEQSQHEQQISLEAVKSRRSETKQKVEDTGSSGDAFIGSSQPFTEKEIPSYYKFDKRYPGIRFFGSPWRQQVTSDGAHIKEWGEEIGIEFDVPPGAVPQGKKLDLSVWPCSAGPFQLPERYALASPVFLISPSFQFSHEVTLKMHHFYALETKEDCEDMAFLSSPATPSMQNDKQPVYKFRVLSKGVFEPSEEYGKVSLKHFCLAGLGKRKRPKSIAPSTKESKRCVYKVYRDNEFEDRVVFSAFPNSKLNFTMLEEWAKENFPPPHRVSVDFISIEEDRVALEWPAGTGWEITPDRRPCAITTEMMDCSGMIPYPPIITLKVTQRSSVATPTPIEVDVLGITEKGKKFILNPQYRPEAPPPAPPANTVHGEPVVHGDEVDTGEITVCLHSGSDFSAMAQGTGSPQYQAVLQSWDSLVRRLASLDEDSLKGLLRQFQIKQWLRTTAKTDADGLIILALNKIETDANNYKLFIEMLSSVIVLRDIVEKIKKLCPLSASEGNEQRATGVQTKLSDKISDVDAEQISTYISKWEPLAPHLGLGEPKRVEITKAGEYDDQKRKLMSLWIKNNGKKATYSAVIDAARKAGDIDLVDNVEELTKKS